MRFRTLVVPAVLAAVLTGCSNVELTATQRMNDLLPFQEELPDGYVREWIDMDGFDGRLSSAEHISSVSSSSCGDALAEPPDVFPEGTGEGAALSLRPPAGRVPAEPVGPAPRALARPRPAGGRRPLAPPGAADRRGAPATRAGNRAVPGPDGDPSDNPH
ncbi:hypothetical protein ACOQFV_02895 [Nocardiopsis changdeensis]|uniref:Lipoprotein n=1 Tax=Nocardiopsis changdeensis TaxID=2831969 RepID=A0ABX8BPA0_9ACTN|nr:MULTISPECIES: hypothetical protein [Nocardiopsis]QUX22573.1 hypothetical protein KGD84_30470 [Nocardiopsis changdeensis]QYX38514.1 hypothetical protein K1J57_07850 [Nocardiopsis sp. MT53]